MARARRNRRRNRRRERGRPPSVASLRRRRSAVPSSAAAAARWTVALGLLVATAAAKASARGWAAIRLTGRGWPLLRRNRLLTRKRPGMRREVNGRCSIGPEREGRTVGERSAGGPPPPAAGATFAARATRKRKSLGGAAEGDTDARQPSWLVRPSVRTFCSPSSVVGRRGRSSACRHRPRTGAPACRANW